MKSKMTKTGASLFLVIALTLCAALSLPVSANAASSAVEFDVIQQVNGAVYAASNYCGIGMNEIKDAYTFCVVGDQVYFFADWEPESPFGGSLYVSKLDGSGKKLLAEYCDGSACYLDGKLYYNGASNEDGKSGGVYSMDVNTGKKKKLVAGGRLISIYDNTIYYRNSSKGGVYRCTLTGGKKKLFSNLDGYDYGVVSDGKYFAKPDDDNGIFVLDLESSSRYERVAYAEEYVGGFMVDAGWVYYVRGNELYKCKTDAYNGSGEVKLCSVSSGSYGASPVKVVGNTLYFIEFADQVSANTFLYKVPVTGGQKAFTGKSWIES